MRVRVAFGVLEEVLQRNDGDLVASPLGLRHPDHLATAAACLEVALRRPALRWLLYEDAIYRADRGATEEAMGRVTESGFELEPVECVVDDRKRAAIDCYTSQLKGLGDLVRDAYEPERYWTLVRRA